MSKDFKPFQAASTQTGQIDKMKLCYLVLCMTQKSSFQDK